MDFVIIEDLFMFSFIHTYIYLYIPNIAADLQQFE